jgi:sugar phosphate isomerase/epimerase
MERTVLGAEGLILATTPLVSHRAPITAAHARSLIDAAAEAGYAGVSIWTAHHDWAVADGMSSEAYLDYHRERGLAVPAAEILLDWPSLDGDALVAANAPIIDVAARMGASQVLAAVIWPDVPPLADLARRLGVLCDLAAERGLRLSFEFLPWSGVPTLAEAVRLLEIVDRDNAGFVLDAWHWFRQPGGPDVDTLAAIGAERIHILQLNDAPAAPAPDLMIESGARLLPGEGVVDILGLLDLLADIGAAPVVASEVFSARLTDLAPADNARRQYGAAMAVLNEHAARRAPDPGAA